MRSEGYGSWVCLCVSLSVGASTHFSIVCFPENDTIYCTGNDNQFYGAVFFLNTLRCRDLSAVSIVRIQTVGHFYSAENACALFLQYYVVEVAFFLLGEKEDFPKFRAGSCLRARFAHNVKLVYYSS